MLCKRDGFDMADMQHVETPVGERDLDIVALPPRDQLNKFVLLENFRPCGGNTIFIEP